MDFGVRTPGLSRFLYPGAAEGGGHPGPSAKSRDGSSARSPMNAKRRAVVQPATATAVVRLVNQCSVICDVTRSCVPGKLTIGGLNVLPAFLSSQLKT